MDRFNYDWLCRMIDDLSESDRSLDKEALQAYLIMEKAHEESALESRIVILIHHLLKWKYQPERQCTSWVRTIREQRRQISKLAKRNTNLAKLLDEFLADEEVYKEAVDDAVFETGLGKNIFPNHLEFTREQILNFDFYPE